MKNTVRIAGAVLLTIVSSVSQAETVVEAMQDCRNESNDLKRLICFDKVAESMNIYVGASQSVEAVAESRPQAAAAASAVTASAASASAPAEEFGLEHKKKPEESTPDEMKARIVSLVKNARGEFTVELDNGMVWRQKGKTNSLVISEGDAVTIERGMMGAFYLSREGYNRRVNVNRIK